MSDRCSKTDNPNKGNCFCPEAYVFSIWNCRPTFESNYTYSGNVEQVFELNIVGVRRWNSPSVLILSRWVYLSFHGDSARQRTTRLKPVRLCGSNSQPAKNFSHDSTVPVCPTPAAMRLYLPARTHARAYAHLSNVSCQIRLERVSPRFNYNLISLLYIESRRSRMQISLAGNRTPRGRRRTLPGRYNPF